MSRPCDAMLLVDAMRDPAGTARLDADGWNALIAMARAEQMIGSLAHRLNGQALSEKALPERVAAIMAEARVHAAQQRRAALWEGECALRALEDYHGKVVLLKGTAYAAAGLEAAEGRFIGDLDIMVAGHDLGRVERALQKAGWEWVKQDAYDDLYYRQWMHELPPMIHAARDRMIDVHHTILPKTAKPTPDAGAMLDAAVALNPAEPPVRERRVLPRRLAQREGLHILAPADMLCHAAAHLIADGDLSGGLRNLWDIDRLVRQYADQPNFLDALRLRALRHGLKDTVMRALRLAHALYDTPVDADMAGRLTFADRLFIRRMTARDALGRATRKGLRLGFYVRGHLLRMPLKLLIPHLWTKWRKGGQDQAAGRSA